jgi:hypothetical protein
MEQQWAPAGRLAECGHPPDNDVVITHVVDRFEGAVDPREGAPEQRRSGWRR